MIETRELRAGYYSGLDILQGVSVAAAPGRVTAVLGANGVGKSTLLKAIYGFLKPSSGRVLVDGVDITAGAPHRMVEHGLTYAPQNPGIFAEMSVEENVLLGAWSFRRDQQRVRRKLEENYARFPVLEERRGFQALTFSGGQRPSSPSGRHEGQPDDGPVLGSRDGRRCGLHGAGAVQCAVRADGAGARVARGAFWAGREGVC